jgi:hypothetical protein
MLIVNESPLLTVTSESSAVMSNFPTIPVNDRGFPSSGREVTLKFTGVALRTLFFLCPIKLPKPKSSNKDLDLEFRSYVKKDNTGLSIA